MITLFVKGRTILYERFSCFINIFVYNLGLARVFVREYTIVWLEYPVMVHLFAGFFRFFGIFLSNKNLRI